MADQQDLELAKAPAAENSPGNQPHQPPASSTREAPDKPSQPPDEEKEKNPRRKWLIRIIFLVVIVIAAIVATIYHFQTVGYLSTDDAFTDGDVVTIAPRVSGEVVGMPIFDNEFVHKGDPLFEIDPRDYQAARDQAAGQLEVAAGQLAFAQSALTKARVTFPAQLAAAKGNLAAAQGQLYKAQSDYKRQHAIARAATTQEQVDTSTATLRQAEGLVQQAEAQVQEAAPVPENISQAEAQARQLQGTVAQAKAALAQANLNLSYTKVVAPQDGYVTKRNVEVGDYAQPGVSMLSLVTPVVWVTANLKETQLGRLRAGQKVTIGVDAYPALKLRGHVDSVQAGTGSKFTAFPPENATGNFVKIVQRVPVKIDIDSGMDPKLPLPLGLSVEPSIHIGDTPEAGH